MRSIDTTNCSASSVNPMTDRPIPFTRAMVVSLLESRVKRRRLYVCKGEDCNSTEHISRRLANGLDAAPADGCWVWQRTQNNKGYGQLRIDGRMHYAHRVAYTLSHGPIPEGMSVLHSCDNPLCINPAHLRAGTQSENMSECYVRGRARIPSPRLEGEKNGAAKLTITDVEIIRAALLKGERQSALAIRFNISQTLVSAIKRGRVWRNCAEVPTGDAIEGPRHG